MQSDMIALLIEGSSRWCKMLPNSVIANTVFLRDTPSDNVSAYVQVALMSPERLEHSRNDVQQPEQSWNQSIETRRPGAAMKVARTWSAALVLLISLIAASAELSSVDRRVSRRAKRDRIFSRTLSDHSSSMPHGFYTRSTDVGCLPP